MARMVSEGVRLPDVLDQFRIQGDMPETLLVPFMERWRVFGGAFDNFTAFVEAAKAAGIPIVPIPGASSAFRPYRQQVALFLSRYTLEPMPGSRSSKVWEGRRYHLRPGMAMAATPGSSMHGWGLAIDFMREGGRAITLAERRRLREIGRPFAVVDTVSSENWHFAVVNADMAAGFTPPAPPQVETPLDVQASQMRVLSLGMVGMDVALVQNIVRDKAAQACVGPSDAIFGASTEQGVKNVQAFCGLTPTGVVDQATWRLLLHIDRQ